jgi:hypothetical protein
LVVVPVDGLDVVLVVVGLATVGRLVVGRLAVAGGVIVAAGRLIVGVAAARRRDGGHLWPVGEDGSSRADGSLPSGEFRRWVVLDGDWGFFFCLQRCSDRGRKMF